MNYEQIREVLDNIKYKDWYFHLEQLIAFSYEIPNVRVEKELYILQIRFLEKDADLDTEIIGIQHGRKWILSKHMTESEIVQTALKAVLTAIEHEAREFFCYKNERIYAPHYNADLLVDLCRKADDFFIQEFRERPGM